MNKKPPEENIFSGPEIMRQPGKRKSNTLQAGANDSYWKQLKLYIKGNSLSAALIIVGWVAVMVVLFSMFTVSKAWLCPDFANPDKNKAWYCK